MKSDGSTRLSCTGLCISVPGRNLIADLTIDVCPGEILAVLGPNGVGKSLALHTLAGLRPIQSGAVKLNDNNIGDVARQQIATQLALLPQYTEDIFPATVFDTVLVGRHPHVGKFHWESDEDRDIARDALRQLDLADLAGRDVTTLAGGERQRLAVAQVLTQATQIYLLDEPTNHLDLDAIVWLERWLIRYQGTLLVISHDREFLDNVVGGIAHIEHHKIVSYQGDYTSFERQRGEQLMQQQSIYEKQQLQRVHLQKFVDRFKYKASKARQAQSRIKALEKLQAVVYL